MNIKHKTESKNMTDEYRYFLNEILLTDWSLQIVCFGLFKRG